MYSSQSWPPQTVDESEDAEVQGILGAHGRAEGNAHGNNGMPGTSGEHADHYVNHFLIGKGIFAPSGNESFMKGAGSDGEQSQLNANVKEFTPRGAPYMVQMPTPPPGDPYSHNMMPSYDGMWHPQQGAHDERAQHRTPGPGQQPDQQGRAPLNSFLYGFGGLPYQPGAGQDADASSSAGSAPLASSSSTAHSQFGHAHGHAAPHLVSDQAFFGGGGAENNGAATYGMDAAGNGEMSWYEQLPRQHEVNPDQGAGLEFHQQQSHHHQQQQHFVSHEMYAQEGNGSMVSGMAPLNFDGAPQGFHAHSSSSFFSVPEDVAVRTLGASFSQLGFDDSSPSQQQQQRHLQPHEGPYDNGVASFGGGHPPPGYMGGYGPQQPHQVQGYSGPQGGPHPSASHSYYGSNDPSTSSSSAAIPGAPESYGSASSSGLAFMPSSRQRDATASFDSSTDQKSIGTPVSTPQSSPMRGPQMSPQHYSGGHVRPEYGGGHGSPQRGPGFGARDPAGAPSMDSQLAQHSQHQARGGYIGALSSRGGNSSSNGLEAPTGGAARTLASPESSSPPSSTSMPYSAALTGGMRKAAAPTDGEDERKEKRDLIGSPNPAAGGRPASSSFSSTSGTWSSRAAAAAGNNINSGGRNKRANQPQNAAIPQQQQQQQRPLESSGAAQDPEWVQKKKAELDETPQTRSVFKEFYKTFRSKEKESVAAAFAYARGALHSKDVPERIHWKIYLEMADLAKRENQFQDARELYQLVNKTQPFAHQGWLEYSKMEEECGRLLHCRSILQQGLEYCNYAEQLLTKAIKHEERLGNLNNARALLSRLRTQNVEKAWRTILEGALLEARAGNIVVARKVFKYLMENVPWYGPIYFEATRFEEKNEEFDRAIAIVEKGLKEIPRYGPLWFNAFRLHEKTEMEQAMRAAATAKTQRKPRDCHLLRSDDDRARFVLQDMFGVREESFMVDTVPCKLLQTRGALQRAMNCISKELVWKVHFEAAQVAERGGGAEALQRARHAYVQSVLRCPVNLRWKVWLAGARAELAHANMEKARQLLDRALIDVPAKSRAQVLLECSRIEEYEGNVDKARQVLIRAREETRHEWKVFLEAVMLELRNGHREDAIRAAEDALATHSGTGRLWAILVQLKHAIGPDSQRLVFREALKSCPKSGEVWCEGARLHMNPVSPYFDLETAFRYLEFAIQFTPQYGGSFLELLRWKLLQSNFGDHRAFPDYAHIEDADVFRDNMLACDTTDIELRCVNADPNYGALWFHCKRGPFDTARQVLRTAKGLMIEELTKFRAVYREAIVESIHRKRDTAARQISRANSRTTPALAGGEDRWLTERLTFVRGAETYANFSTGLLSVNWLGEHVGLLVDRERRKFLFGSDQIVP